MKIAVGISGASGAIYGIRLLEALKRQGVETHLVISAWGEYTIREETEWPLERVKALASHCHDPADMAAPISSGSYPLDAMVVCPCSMKTLAGIASGYSEDLIMRAADVCLKERRALILCTRETPLSRIHIENMLRATDAGAIIMPPMPAFYTKPASVDEIVEQSVNRLLDRLGLPADGLKRWKTEQERQPPR
ncbi:MAG: UbiX family flavin prenyltransferase [Candidatus Accumulibacter sp.]|jgi:polyprenyl P-hydroxybenzoate/phenylacrylic acid decarboxylase-like protein|nr:UbiX family flavin prenyltransferase [Accumulibacter sp.]